MSDDPSMTYLANISELVDHAPESTVSRTVLKGEGARLVLFSFATGQELSEHTAAVPVLLQTLDGSLEVSASGETVTLAPGDVIHLPSRLPHSVVANEPSRMLLTMLDPRQAAPLKPTH
ncbi:MAG: cupin domain-containing protein [Actinomycetes bacterium]